MSHKTLPRINRVNPPANKSQLTETCDFVFRRDHPGEDIPEYIPQRRKTTRSYKPRKS